MFSLLLDSSNKYLSVGLAKDGKVIDQIYYEAWQRQSEVMVSEIGNLMNRNQLNKNDLSSIVVGIGPGSYTGVRIAITIAKTIAFSSKINVYQVSSLSLLKISNLPTICVFNARSGRSYYGVYEGDKVLVKDTVGTNEELLSYISMHKDYKLTGDVEQLGLKSDEFNIIDNLAKGINDENLVDPFHLNPIYLKDILK